MHRGKKLSDPVPKVRGSEAYDGSLTDLENAWNTVGKARSELRKIENRLGDVNRVPPGDKLNLTGETSITDYSHLSGTSANQTYNIPDTAKHFPSGAVVDSNGWSKHVHQNKYLGQGVRKVSRLVPETKGIDPVMTQRGRHVTNHLMSDLPLDLPNRDPGLNRNDPRGASPKKVDFNNQLELRRINTDGTYTDSFSFGAGQPGPSRYTNTDYLNDNPDSYLYPNSQSTLTDSRALRETEIRFLNNPAHSQNSKQRPDAYDIRWNKVSSRLTHVDIKVPSASNYRSSSRQPGVDDGSQPLPVSSRTLRTGVYPGSDKASNGEVKVDGYSSATSEGSEGSNGKHLKKHLKDFDRDTGALAKLKERIRQQRLLNSASPVTDTEPILQNQNTIDQPTDRTRRLHGECDPVEMAIPKIAWETERYQAPMPRKVAAGPPAPVYKGFNEVESKYKLVKPIQTARRKNKKKTTSVQIQEKKQDDNDSIQEQKITEERPKKRVVATRDKSGKHRATEMITTSSWRTGQQVILQTLGPSKSTRTARTRETTKNQPNNDMCQAGSSQHKGVERPEPLGGSEMSNNDAATKVLSEEARQVLNDLQIGQQDGTVKSDSNICERAKKPAVKRKAPRPQDSEKQQPAMKTRHYDADSVRQYMLKQREERMKRKREEHQAQQKAENERRKHLDELYKKQKKSQKKPQQKTGTSKFRELTPSDPVRPAQVAWEDQLRTVVGNESDQENKELDLSDDSSTITNEDSVGDSTPVATPRETDKVSKTSKHGYETGPLEIDTLIGQSRLYQDPDSRGAQSVEGRRVQFTAPAPASDLGLFSSLGQYRTRAERIQAIKDTAATLQSRLQAEAQRLGDQGSNQHAASLPMPTMAATSMATRWGSSSTGGTVRPVDGAVRPADGALTRHERIAGVQDDFTVFTSNLPGVQSLSSHLEQVDHNKNQDVAASRIQAAYRGKTVREALDWKLPSGKSLGNKIQSAGSRPRQEKYEDLGEDSSTFSDITVTDESDAESTHAHTRKIGSGLTGRDFLPGDRYRREVLEEARREPDTLPNKRYRVPEVNWDRPPPDPYSTFNVFTRNYHQSERERQTGLENRPPVATQRQITTTSTYRDITRQPSGAVTQPSGTVTHAREGRQSPEGIHNDTSERITETHRKSEHRQEEHNKGKQLRESDPLTSHRSEDIRSRLVSASFHPGADDFPEDRDEDVTIEGENSYTQSIDSESEEKTPSNRSKFESVAMENLGEQETKKSYVAREEDFMESEVSSVAEDEFPMSVHSKISLESRPQVTSGVSQPPPRYSPNALERKLAAELNLLESMEESMRQLTGVERSRAVSMAQQETVSLAQILKSRQQVHDVQMKDLQLKARQETNEASQQLEEARKRAAEAAQNAVQMIAMVRGGETSQSLQESTRKLIESQAEAARATAEAAKYLSRGVLPAKTTFPSKARESAQGKQSKSVLQRAAGEDYSERTQPSTGRSVTYSRDYTDLRSVSNSAANLRPKSRSTSGRSSQSADVVTANDSQEDKKSLSIHTASGAEAKDESKSESIVEDLSYAKGSGDDYSMNFDESMTEDEVEEKSFRMVLPSESHRRKAKHQRTQSDVSVTSEDMSGANDVSSAKFGGEDLSSLFIGEDSFNRFTTEMVNQYMREEELRAQHQASLLKLREKALREKTKSELAWLDQQRKRMRNKGSDDAYPQIKKRQRGLILKLEQEQAEIKRLQEANQAATKERQKILRQQQELQKLRKTTQNTWEKVHRGRPSRTDHRGFRQDDIHTEDEVTLPYEDKSDAGEDLSKKDVKSDSEIYTDQKEKRKSETSAMTKLRNVHLDQRYLTAREKKLRDRRKNAEQLLAWKKKLDDEEQRIYELEKKAIDLWDGSTEKTGRSSENKVKDTRKGENADALQEKAASKVKQAKQKADSAIPKKDQPKELTRSESETSISEVVSRSQFSRSELSKTDTSKSRIPTTKASVAPKSDRVATTGRHQRSESEGSIAEDIQSQSSSNAEDSTSIGPLRKKVDSTQTRSQKSYGEDSFASNGSITASSRKSPLKKLLSPPGLLFDPTRSPLSPGKHYKRGSESESEESLQAETASDQSDVEGRVRALTDELERRKLQLDRLKKEHDKKKQEKLKAHEQSLMKQIEVYDNFIKRMSDEKTELEHERLVAGKKPQIKRPKGRDHRQRSSQEEGSPHRTHPPPQRSESESSRSSQSSSFEESRESLDSTQTSPAVQLDSVKKVSPLESISERNETPPSDRARRSLLGKDTSDKKSATPALLDDSDLAQRLPEDVSTRLEENVSLFMPSGIEEKISLSLKPDQVDSKPTEVVSRAEVTPRSHISDIVTAHSEVSEQISEKASSQVSDDTLGFKPLGIVQTVDNKDADELADKYSSEIGDGDGSLKSDRSDRSDAYSTKTGKTLSERSEVSYTEDFSEVETTEKGKASGPLAKQDSLQSQDDISEHFSVASDVSEKISSAPLLDLKAVSPQKDNEVKVSEQLSQKEDRSKVCVLEEESTPIQSPRDAGENLIEFTPADQEKEEMIVDSPVKSEALSKAADDTESILTDSELDNVIKSTAAAVEEFDSTPFSSPENKTKSPKSSTKPWSSEKLIDSITDDLTHQVLKDSMSTISQIAARRSPLKTPPATLPKPKRTASLEPANEGLSSQQTARMTTSDALETPAVETIPAVTVSTPSLDSTAQRRPAGSSEAEMNTDSTMSNMLNEAISDMITIRNKQRGRFQAPGAPEESVTVSNGIAGPEEDSLSGIPRPGSPVPGEKPVLTQEEISKLDEDLNEIYGTEDEYHDDDEWFRGSPVPNKPPPPYPGTAEQGQLPYQLSRTIHIEEPQYAVPHNKDDVKRILGNAVEIYWLKRRYGESLDTVEAPETYFSLEDNGVDMDSVSRRAYKKLLFELAGEIIREVYKVEEEDSEPNHPWKKPKAKRQKYYKGVDPPTTVEVLTALVQDTSVLILGLNGSQKLDPRANKWGVRKKKDNVDSILAQELREDEPNWVNYDSDELAVKMHLTDTIFDSLLQDTVETMNSIFKKRKSRTEDLG